MSVKLTAVRAFHLLYTSERLLKAASQGDDGEGWPKGGKELFFHYFCAGRMKTGSGDYNNELSFMSRACSPAAKLVSLVTIC